MDYNGEKFLENLSVEIAKREANVCPSPEDISELLDGNLSDKSADDLKKHIASCEECYELYKLASELREEPVKKSLSIFSISSIAASVVIVATSFFILYRTDKVTDEEMNPVRKMVAPPPKARLLKMEKMEVKKGEKKSGNGSPESPVLNVVGNIVNEKIEESVKERSIKKGFAEEPEVSYAPIDESFRDSGDGERLKKRKREMKALGKSAKPVKPIQPEILKIIQPEDRERLKNISGKNNVNLKILINSEGDVKDIKLLSEEEEWSSIVIDAVRKWKFEVSGVFIEPFELELKITSEGNLEIIKKK